MKVPCSVEGGGGLGTRLGSDMKVPEQTPILYLSAN